MSLLPHQYDEIMRSYDRLRLNNRDLQQKRIEEIYRVIPDYKDAEDELASTAVALARPACGERPMPSIN